MDAKHNCKQSGDILSSWASSFPRKSILKIALTISSGKQSATAKEYARKTSRWGSKEPTNTEKGVRVSLKYEEKCVN